MPWREQPLPSQPEASVVGCWELTAPSDVCRARRQLRAAVAGGGDGGQAAAEDALDQLLLVVEELVDRRF